MEDKTLDILEKYLDKDFKVSPMSPNSSTIGDIRAIEETLGIEFPKEYTVHLLAEGTETLGGRGIYIEVKEDVWPGQKNMM